MSYEMTFHPHIFQPPDEELCRECGSKDVKHVGMGARRSTRAEKIEVKTDGIAWAGFWLGLGLAVASGKIIDFLEYLF